MSKPEFSSCIGGPDGIITCKWAKNQVCFVVCAADTHTHTHTHTHSGCEWEHWAEPHRALPELTGEQRDWDCWAFSCNYCSIFLMKSSLFSRGTESSNSKGHALLKHTCDWMNNHVSQHWSRKLESMFITCWETSRSIFVIKKVHQCLFCLWKTLQIWYDWR